MIAGVLGKKLGMTQVFDENGTAVGVTVLEVGPCTVLQIKTEEKDGYSAIQLGFADKKRSRATKPETGHVRKVDSEPKKFVREIRCDAGDASGGVEAGATVGVSVLEGVDSVDIIGQMKGRGFTGVMKRWGFHGQSATHGVKRRHRSPGSIGASASPARVIKGVKMAGRMGGCRRTSLNLKVVDIDVENNLLIVRGAVPGANGGHVLVRPSNR